MKKTLSLVLSALMVVSLLCLGVNAAEGTAITDAAGFAAMTADGTYYLDADITIDATYEADFTGTLDGNGHTVTISVPMFKTLAGTVKNLTINGTVTVTGDAYAATVALYGKGTVTVDNVVNNATISSENRTGGLIAQINNGTVTVISNCVNNGEINSPDAAGMIGGLVGYIQGTTMTVENCVNTANITGKGITAGIIGRFGGDNMDGYLDHILNVTNCLNTGDINATNSNAAGILGYARGCTAHIVNCTNEGNITATTDCGGIFGSANVTTVSGTSNRARALVAIDKCVNKGDVTGPSKSGGIGGYLWASTDFNHAEVTNCVNYGTITTTATGAQAVSQIFAYTNYNQTVLKNNVGLGKVVVAAEGSAFACGIGFSSADIPTADFITNNVFVEGDGTTYATYSVTAGKEYNIIKIEEVANDNLVTPDMMKAVSKDAAEAAVAALGEIGYITSAPAGDGIVDAAGWAAMAPDGSYVLGADITIDTTFEADFTGTIDGNGHTITTSVPLFNKFGGTLKNVTIAGEIVVTEDAVDAAAISLQALKNSTIVFENVTNNANVTGTYRTGGFFAEEKGGQNSTTSVTFIDCTNNGNITGSGMVGAFYAYMQGYTAVLTNCKNTGDISVVEGKTGLAGGIVGRHGGDYALVADRFATLTNCVNEGNVTATSYAGGMMGDAKGSVVTFDRCVNNGDITTDVNAAAGMLANGGAADKLATCNFIRCINNGNCTNNGLSASGTACAAGICGYVYGSGDGAAHMKYCINTGDMTGYVPNDSAEAAQFMFVSNFQGYTNNTRTSIESCFGSGKLDGKLKVICGLSSADPLQYVISDVVVAEAPEYFSYATAESNAGHIVTFADYQTQFPGAITVSSTAPTYPAEDPTTAEITTEAPTTAEQTTAAAPGNDTTAAPGNDTTAAPAVDETTAAPEATTAAPKEDKGCGSVVACGVALVAILGTAYVAKRKF